MIALLISCVVSLNPTYNFSIFNLKSFNKKLWHLLFRYGGIIPRLVRIVFWQKMPTMVGQVTIGDHCSIWFNTVIRGDVNSITIGNNTNIQDGVVIHCTYEKAATHIGSYVSVGHNAIVHGCTLEDRVLIGMGAIVMDHAVVKTGSLIAAGSVVLENTVIEPYSLYAGTPARKIKEIGEENASMIERIANNYLKYSKWYEK